MAVETPAQLDRERIRELIERETGKLDARTQGSAAMYRRARESLSGGVAILVSGPRSVADLPHDRGGPGRLRRRRQPHVGLPQRLRVDGAGPRATRRSSGRSASGSALGTHFAATTEDGVIVAEELKRRWGLERWRYVNSGSEATMDAIRIARGVHRPRHDHEDLRLLPRPPRRRDGVDRGRVRPHRRPRELRLAALWGGHPRGGRRT